MAKGYYEHGKLKSETPYTRNFKLGMMREYYENGGLKTKKLYANDKCEYTVNFDSHGNEVK